MDICDKLLCTGCFACRNICPNKAIVVSLDKYGKTVPVIEESKCIGCNACRNVCPVHKPLKKYSAEYAIAAWSNQPKDRELSSSGGAATVLSRSVIKQGGAVFGVTVSDGTVKYIKVNDQNGLDKIRGSKYVQSDVGYIYRDVKEELETKKQVLFIGTPCQVAGLKNYLNKDYENLHTIDLICHGTPPIKYLQEYVEKRIKGRKYGTVSFRGKYDFYLTIWDETGDNILYKCRSNYDAYYRSFLDGLTYRDSCYQCTYSCLERVSDITVGDFWGIDRSKLANEYQGRISLILPNTTKGKNLFNVCKDGFVWELRNIKEAVVPEQTNLIHPSIPNEERNLFLKNYEKLGFERAVRKTKLYKQIKKERLAAVIGNTVFWKIIKSMRNGQ